MAAADPKPSLQQSPGRRPWVAIRDKLERLVRNTSNRDLDRYRVEIGSIIETLDAVNRDTDGLRGRGHRGG